MTFENPPLSDDSPSLPSSSFSISEASTVAEIELATMVCELSGQVVEIRQTALEAHAMLVRALEALRDIGCLDNPRVPCGECWPCTARLGLRPIPLH
jgi:hypothetical protein